MKATGSNRPLGDKHFDVLAFRCDPDGVVSEIVADYLPLERPLRVGQSMLDIIDPHSHEKAVQFLDTIVSRQAASGWELNVSGSGQPVSAVFTGTMQQGSVFIVVGRTARDITNVVETLEQINNEQLNVFRMAFRDQLESFERRGNPEASAYEELSRLNNELSNAQRDLSQKSNELTRLNEEKNRFLGMAAHDLRNPLSVILGYAGFLAQDENDDPEKKLIYAEIASSSRFMLDLINDLLDVSSIEAGRRELRVSTFDPLRLLRQVVKTYSASAAAKEIRVSLECGREEEEVTMISDEARLRQVLGNLIGNAVKYSQAGTAIEISANCQGEQLTVAVKDQGIGIPADQLGTIFQPFVHLDSSGTAGERSTGLGLSIVAQLVELLSGEVTVESEVGKGSTFRLTVPLVMTGRPR